MSQFVSGPVFPFPANTSAKDFPAQVEARFATIVGNQAGPLEPTVKSIGSFWYAIEAIGRSDGMYRWTGTDWVFMWNPAAGTLVQAGATINGSLNLGGHPLTGLTHSSSPDSAARRDRAVDPQSPQVLANLNMADGAGGFFQLVNTGTPTAPSHVMRQADFRSGVASLALVSGQDSTTGDVDLGFVPRALSLSFRGGTVDGVSQLVTLQAPALVLAQPLTGTVAIGLDLVRADANSAATPFVAPASVVIVNATARGFRLNVPRVGSGAGGITFGGLRGLTGDVHYMAWR